MRFISRFFFTITLVFLLLVLSFFIILSSRYGLPLVTWVINTTTPYAFSAEGLDYDVKRPFTFALKSPKLFADKSKIEPPLLETGYLSASLSLDSIFHRRVKFDHLLLSEIDLNNWLTMTNNIPVQIKQLGIEKASAETEVWAISNAAFQLRNWRNEGSIYGTWKGRWQFTADDFIFNKNQITKVFLDGKVHNDTWSFPSVSFENEFGTVTATGTIDEKEITLSQLTVSDTKLDNPEEFKTLENEVTQLASTYPVYIKRIDLFDFSLYTPELSIEHLNLSGSDLKLNDLLLLPSIDVWPPLSPWSSSNSSISFNASLFTFKERVFTDLLGDVRLHYEDIKVAAFSANFNEQGYLSFSGDFSPTNAHFNHLFINGTSFEIAALPSISGLTQLETLSFDKISLRNINLTSFDKNFPMQWLDIRLKGKDITLLKHSNLGIWSGNLRWNAEYSSVNRVPMGRSHIAINVKDEQVQIDPIDIGFTDGQIIGNANVDIANASMPWSLSLTGLNAPTEVYQQWANVNLPMQGLHDMALQFNGLASGWDSLRYSFSGNLTAQPQTLTLKGNKALPLPQLLVESLAKSKVDNEEGEEIKLNAEEIKLSADRGRISLAPLKISSDDKQTYLIGNWDLVTEDAGLQFESQLPASKQ